MMGPGVGRKGGCASQGEGRQGRLESCRPGFRCLVLGRLFPRLYSGHHTQPACAGWDDGGEGQTQRLSRRKAAFALERLGRASGS